MNQQINTVGTDLDGEVPSVSTAFIWYCAVYAEVVDLGMERGKELNQTC